MEIVIFYIVLFVIMILLIQALPVLIPLFIILYLLSLLLGYRRRSQTASFHSEPTKTRAPKEDAIDVDYTEREDEEQ